MKLTWRDGVTTLLAAAIVALYYAVTRGVDVPLIGSTLAAMVTVGIVGVIMGVIGLEKRDFADEEAGWLGTMMIMGLVTVALFVAGFFYTTTAMLLTLTIAVLATWAVGMAHHLVSASDEVGSFVTA